MAVTNNNKVVVDMPVWEWTNFAPATTTAISALTTPKVPGRYLYYQVSGVLYRYDTYTDSWHQLASCANTTPTVMVANQYSPAVGYYGRAISAGGGNNTIELAGLSGQSLVNYKIRIIGGTGAGQEKTITAVSAPIVADRGVTTTGSTSAITDASTGLGLKQWKANQYRDYQIRIDFGTGQKQCRKILYNAANSITWSDANLLTTNPWASCLMSVTPSSTAGAQSLYTIESHIVTVDTNWTINPDNTSQFVVLSGGIWTLTQGTTSAPFFCLQYYDVLADVWYGKSTQSGIKAAVFLAASDLSIEVMTEVNGAVVAATTATSGAARSLTNTGLSMTPMDFANMELRIVGGTGKGQARTILSNTATVFNVYRDWDTNPDNTSSYEVWRDTGKVWALGGGDSGLLQYSQETDQWSTGKQLDFGQCQTLAAKRSGENPYAIASITRTATGATTINATPTAAGYGYNIDDILTVTAGGNATLRVTAVNAVGGVTAMALETCGTGCTVAAGKSTSVVPTGGSGCMVEITAVDFTGLVATTLSHLYKIGDSVVISGATSTGAANFNGTKTILGVPSATGFSYALGGDPGAATATGTSAVSTTVLVDCTKNWTVNEHVGKIIQISNNVLLASSAQARKIVSNTANTITWTSATSASTPAVGTYRYIIEDCKPFGTDISLGGRKGLGTEGFATSGSTTTLVDSTKNWPINYWSRGVGRRVRIVEGTGVGNEISIISNTATSLTFVAQGFTVDTTTRYVIMDTFGSAAGAGGISTIAVAPTAGGTGYAVGDVSNVTGGTARVVVTSVSGGIVQSLQLLDGGTAGYTVVTGVATTNVTGTGVNMTVNVTAITAVGTTTVLQDNTKNWDVNVWAGKRLRFLTGTGSGQEFPIVSNTFNTLTYTAITTAPDASTTYAILEAAPKSFGVHIDMITKSTNTAINSRYMYSFTGSATSEISRYKVSSEHWELITSFPLTETLTTGSMYVYDQADRIYFTKEATGRIMYYDIVKNIVVPSTTVTYGMSTAISGNRMEVVTTADGLQYLYIMRHSAQEMWRELIFW